ncbi:hypothetical protein [Paenibacillus thalictri]|uniref:DUF4179 domain-containing protein n=1 Tax=Paenibacillus thalictri TaxID=2527873 RepID=A0A4Q9DP42_9BACL|nr:hypothetical protein [Paenibacillus thalictri]TBL75382.1 hypothetical protein EYB31_23565 [Paenibacillus thalictri]
MNKDKEETLYAIMDRLDRSRVLEVLESVELTEEEPVAPETAERIRRSTFAKLGLALGDMAVRGEMPEEDSYGEHTKETQGNAAGTSVGSHADTQSDDVPQRRETSGLLGADSASTAASRTAAAHVPVMDAPTVHEALTSRRRRWSRLSGRGKRYGILAAALTVVIIVVSLGSGSPEVRAQIRKAIQFLPGFAAVQNTQEQMVQYVLPNPIVKKIGGGQLEIRGFSISDKWASATLVGNGIPWIKSFVLSNGQGQQYMLKSAMTSGSGGEWTGLFYYQGKVEAAGSMELYFEMEDVKVTLHLERAEQAERIEDFGVTDTHHGISLTAVTKPAADGQTKLTLVPQTPKKLRIESYGLASYDIIKKPELKSAGGETVKMEQDAVFPNKNELYYRKTAADASLGYTLEVPEIAAIRKPEFPDQQTLFTVPIPAAGELVLNKTVFVEGFPIDLLKVERMPANAQTGQRDSIRIDFDMHYDAGAAESPLYMIPDYTKYPELSGCSFKLNEETGAMEFMVLEVPAGAREYKFYVQETHTVVRGPWEFQLQ